MKILIVYYSRSGHCRKVAEVLHEKLGCDLEEIKTKKNYQGAVGWILAGKEGSQKVSAEIMATEKNPKEYEMVIFGTPIWGWNISSPLRSYLEKNKNEFNKISAFCTMGGQFGKCFDEIELICKKNLETKVAFTDKEIAQGKLDALDNFLK